MKKLLASVAALALLCQPAQANFTFPNASSASVTAFAFDGSTTPAGTSNCASTIECGASVPITVAGLPLFTSTNAGYAQIGSGGVASGAIASGAVASGAVASGAVASGAFASGSIASGAIVDGGDVALGITTVAKNTATDTTSVAVIPLLKELSYMEQNPASRAVTNAGTFAVQAAQATAASLNATVVGTGTFAVQDSTTEANTGTIAGAVTSSVMQENVKQVNGVATLAGAGAVGTGSQRVAVGQDTTTIAGSAPGTAGTASANVVSVQGIASMTPLLANPGTAANWGLFADNAAWSVGTTLQTPLGCEYTSGGATALTTAHMGTPGCTSARGLFTDKSSVAGTALVAAVSAYGTAPTGTEVEGVNAYVTNTLAPGSAVSASSQPVVIASDQAAVAVKAASAAFASGAFASGAFASGSIAAGAIVDGGDVALGTTTVAKSTATDTTSVAAIPLLKEISFMEQTPASRAVTNAGTFATQLTSAAVADPCIFQAKTNLPIATNSTSLAQIIAASASTKIYICSLALVGAGATAFSLNTGTGTNCGSSTAAVIGSTTAANGMSLAANGGITLGNGGGTIAVANVAGAELCTLQSNAVYASGNLTFVQQ